MTATTIGSREARQNWRELLDAAYRESADTIIERNGKPVAVLIPYDDYIAIQESLEDLRAARQAAQAYEAWKKDPSQARPYKEFLADLEADEARNEGE